MHEGRSLQVRLGRVLLLVTAFVALACASHDTEAGAGLTAREREAAFSNGDFESGSNGNPPPDWTVTTYLNPGVNYPPQTRSDLNLAGGGQAVTFTRVGAGPELEIDPQLSANDSLRWPKYGTMAAVVNENRSSRNTNSLKQTMTIGAADIDPADGKAHVRFTVAPVLENPGHPVNQQPYYFVSLRNLTKNTTLYQDFNASAQPGVPWKVGGVTVCYNYYGYNYCVQQQRYYTDWQLVDIAPGNSGLAVGDQVELEVIAAGCSAGGHQGKVWVDGVGSKVPGLFVYATGPSAQNQGQDITYTLTYTNGGTGSAVNTTVDFNTPPSTTWVGLSAPGLTCTQPAVGATGLAQCSIGGLAPGSSGTFQVTVKIDNGASGTITNGNYSIFADGVSALLGPKVYTTITSGITYADLAITKSNGTAGLAWSQAVAYTLTTTNHGPTDVNGATVSDTLPAQLTGATWTCAGSGGGSCTTASGSGNLSATVDLPVGATATFTIDATIIAGSGSGSVSNTATIATPGGVTDPNPNNDSDTDTDAIGEPHTVALTKLGTGQGSVVSSPAAINCGTGCSSANGTFLLGASVVLNALPAVGQTFVGWGGDCASAGSAAQCALTVTGDLSVTATFSPTLTANGQNCSANADCTSDHCVDGVCCDSTCLGQCEACDVGGSVGTCTAVSGAPHGVRAACAEDSPTCAGSCDGTTRASCAYPGSYTLCRSASCSNGVATLAGGCNGAGACSAAQTQDCAPFICGGTACTNGCSGDGDCAASSHCAGGQCVADVATGGACLLDNDCGSKHCVDGVCCDTTCTGQCEACDVPGAAGTCLPVSGAPHGLRPGCTTDSSACGGACDGVTTAACRYPDATVVCRAGSCTAGTATLEARCHGAGTCPSLQTQPCAPFVCGASACLGDCTTNDDCTPADYCSGGVCVPTLDAGTSCSSDDQCASGHCVDDFCCDTACDGQCEACDVGGSVGTCTAVSGAPHGARNACASDATACGGSCDGNERAGCAYPDGSVQCRAAACSSGTATLPGFCDALGACGTLQTQLCAPFACGATACLGDCSGDSDCSPNDYCSAGVCVPTLGPAGTCTADNQCQSGHCVDGVCCDTACDGQCEACGEAGSEGICAAVSGSPRGVRGACAGDGTACAGACDGAKRDACSFPGSDVVCRDAACSNGVATIPAVCNGQGACPDVQTQPCAPFLCGATQCLGDCMADNDCASGSFCYGGICIAIGGVGTTCSAPNQCESGYCVDGVCCDTACDGQCEACDVADSLGTCVAVTGEPHGARERCGGSGECASSCDGEETSACTFPGASTECGAPSCRRGTARAASTCDGAGECVAGETTDCGDYACADGACLTSCEADADCAADFVCDGRICVPAGNGGAGAGNLGGEGGEPAMGTGGTSTGGKAGGGAQGGRGGSAGSAAKAGSASTVPVNPNASFEGGGCSCRTESSGRTAHAWGALAALGALTLFVRRRRVSLPRSHVAVAPRTPSRARRAGVAGLLALAALGYARLTEARGFALDRFDSAERGSRFFSADSLDIAGNGRILAGVVGDFAHKPLVLRDQNGDEISPVIDNQFFLNVGAAVTVIDRLRFGVNLPVLVLQDATTVVGPTGPVSPSEGAGVGDLRLAADVRLLGHANDPVTVGLGVRVYLPTGSPAAFTSDGYVRWLPRAQVAGRVSAFVYSASAGLHFRGTDKDFAGQPVGSELVFGAAAGVIALDDKLVVGPELWASTVYTDGSEAFFGRTSTPVEIALGAHVDVVEGVRLGAGIGPGLSSGMGSPAARYLFSAEWAPPVEKAPEPSSPPPPADRDQDGVLDVGDACPDARGLPDADPAKNGCPAPADADHDGIVDESDACPNDAGPTNDDPKKNGCPPPADADGDGVPDGVDACPREPGVPNDAAPQKNGCPLPADADGDGVLDKDDACPQETGTPNEDPKKNGCPKAVVTAGEIKILDRVEFENGKAALRPESNDVLTAVAGILKAHPEIKRVSVEGHTDDRGAAAANVGLSQRRAAAVVAWLVANGVEESRLTWAGFGQNRPLTSNATDEGRQTNRRVEFKIIEGPGANR